MKRGVWVHQFSQQSEQTAADYANTLLPRGIDTIYAKAMDGTSWMGDFYSHPLAPTNAQRWAEIRSEFLDVGLTLTAWVVPRFSANEADAHLNCNPFVVDFEYQYDGFWKGSDAQAWGYFATLRNAIANGYGIAVAPDPRQVGRDYDKDLIAGLTGYLPQTYWTDFQRPALEVLNSARSSMAGLDPFAPILPYNGTPDDVESALAWCVAQGCESVSMWRMGTANAAQLNAFAQPGEGEGPEEDVDDTERQQFQDKINGLSVTVADIADRLGDQLLAEAKRSSVRKTVVRDIVKQMEAERAQAVGPRP